MKSIMALILLTVAMSLQSEPIPVQIDAEDGQVLHADYYAPSGNGAPAVVLIHQLYTDRTSWDDLIPHLQANGYAVLVPDLRGYGQTRGAINWRAAQQDTVLWVNWLRTQPDVNGSRVSLIGSSMGANLAIIGCADLKTQTGVGCVTAVGISPGLNYFGYTPLVPALEDGMADCPTLFISSQRDGYPARAVHELTAAFSFITPRWFEGNAHGIDLLLDKATIGGIVDWLNAHQPGNAC